MVSRDLRVVWQYFQGPLPPPSVLEDYERALPGSADRIVTMAEQRHNLADRQSIHRQDLEKMVIQSKIKHESRGQLIAAFISLAVLSLGGVLIWNGKEVTGLVAMIGTLVSLVTVFIAGRKKQSQELRDKQ